MSERYPGGLITKTPVTPSGPYETGAAPGVWTLDQASNYIKQGIWPIAGNVPNYIEDVFSTYLYTGNSSTQTITNGIDLAGKGGMVWTKNRGVSASHSVYDTVRGLGYNLKTETTGAQVAFQAFDSFNSNGYTINTDNNNLNASSNTYASWTFRKQPKFFDVVTYTGNGVAGRTIAHNLGSVPGCIIIKSTSFTGTNWAVYHTSLLNNQYALQLNNTGAQLFKTAYWNSTSPSSTVFTLGNDSDVNENGQTYVAYLFAHNAGGFGLTGTDNVISCGSFTTDASGNATVTLGYEPQWVLMKKTSGAESWMLFDNMRGLLATQGPAYSRKLVPNLTNAESNGNECSASSTGFNVGGVVGGATYVYVAIRRGPMKVPTSGTSVFSPIARTGTGTTATVSNGITTDLIISHARNAALSTGVWDRLRGVAAYLETTGTASESTSSDSVTALNNTNYVLGADTATDRINRSGNTYANWTFSRAPGFFDEVCYTGTGGTGSRSLSHNLQAVPELIILKSRSGVANWQTGSMFTSTTVTRAVLNRNDDQDLNSLYSGQSIWGGQPTASTFLIDATGAFNTSAATYVAYLFATCPGVSKVGSYTGTGATQTISCGFTGGARFVLVKRTDSTGDWYVWDTARGMVSGTDPSLLLNSTAAEANANSIYTTTGGFQIVSTAAGINASGGTYIYLAIA